MNKDEFPIVVHALSDDDGGGFLAVVLDLCGCMSDGATVEEALSSVRSAMDEWADEAKRLGRELPAPYTQADRYEREQKALRELIEAQSALIKQQEQALDQQNASLKDLHEQVETLSIGIELRAGDTVIIGCSSTKWARDGILSVPPTHVAARKLQLQH